MESQTPSDCIVSPRQTTSTITLFFYFAVTYFNGVEYLAARTSSGLSFLVAIVAEHFFIYWFLRCAGVSYGRFVAVRFGFNLSTYVQNRW